jgi:hypothetical protein
VTKPIVIPAGTDSRDRFTGTDFWLCAIAVVLVTLLAVPAWQDHHVRQKVSECLALAESVQQQIDSHRRLLHRWPDKLQVSPIARFVVSDTCDGFTSYDPSSGGFLVNVNANAIAENLPLLQPMLTPIAHGGDAISWSCSRGNTRPVALKYLPAQCRGLSG